MACRILLRGDTSPPQLQVEEHCVVAGTCDEMKVLP